MCETRVRVYYVYYVRFSEMPRMEICAKTPRDKSPLFVVPPALSNLRRFPFFLVCETQLNQLPRPERRNEGAGVT